MDESLTTRSQTTTLARSLEPPTSARTPRSGSPAMRRCVCVCGGRSDHEYFFVVFLMRHYTSLHRPPQNVVVVHCKAGRGRTGYMVVCLLLHLQVVESAREGVALFSSMRTVDGNALHHPSQFRYIDYFAELLANTRAAASSQQHHSHLPSSSPSSSSSSCGVSSFFPHQDPGLPAPLRLAQLAIVSPQLPANFNPAKYGDFTVLLRVEEFADVATGFATRVLFDGSVPLDASHAFSFKMSANQGIMHGDIRIQAFDSSKRGSSLKKLLFRLWFHPYYVDEGQWVLRAADLDAVCAVDVDDDEELTSPNSRSGSQPSPSHSNSSDAKFSLFTQQTSVVITFEPTSSSSSSSYAAAAVAAVANDDGVLSFTPVPMSPPVVPQRRTSASMPTPTTPVPMRSSVERQGNSPATYAHTHTHVQSSGSAHPAPTPAATTADECYAQMLQVLERSLLREDERTEVWLKLVREAAQRGVVDAEPPLELKTPAKGGVVHHRVSASYGAAEDSTQTLELGQGQEPPVNASASASASGSASGREVEEPGFSKSRRAIKRILNHERSLRSNLQRTMRCVVWPLLGRLSIFEQTPQVAQLGVVLEQISAIHSVHECMWGALEHARGRIPDTLRVIQAHFDGICFAYESLFVLPGYPAVLDEQQLLRANPAFAQFLTERDAYGRGVDTRAMLLAFMSYPTMYESAIRSFLQEYKSECAIQSMNALSSPESRLRTQQQQASTEALKALTRRLDTLSKQLSDEKVSEENVSFHVLQVNKVRQASKRVIEIDVHHKTLTSRHLPGSASKNGKASLKWKKAPTLIHQHQLTRLKFAGSTSSSAKHKQDNSSAGDISSSSSSSSSSSRKAKQEEQQLTVYYLKNRFLMRSEQSMRLQFFSTHERDRFAVLFKLLLLRDSEGGVHKHCTADLQANADLYNPQPLSISSKALSKAKALPVFRVAEALHHVWMSAKQIEGWHFFATHSEEHRTSPLLVDFKRLPEKTQQENVEIAELTIGAIFMLGYSIQLDLDRMEDMQVARQLSQLTDFLAENAHDTWAEGKVRDGWVYGRVRHNPGKRHPLLLPYVAMQQADQESDRKAATTILETITGLGYHISALE
jgi:hypothetical protein